MTAEERDAIRVKRVLAEATHLSRQAYEAAAELMKLLNEAQEVSDAGENRGRSS